MKLNNVLEHHYAFVIRTDFFFPPNRRNKLFSDVETMLEVTYPFSAEEAWSLHSFTPSPAISSLEWGGQSRLQNDLPPVHQLQIPFAL